MTVSASSGLSEQFSPKDNFSAIAAPGATDDASKGYSPGSTWIDMANDNVYVCADASAGAAVWRMIGGGGSAVHFYAGMSAAQAVAIGAYVKINFDTTSDNTGSAFDTTNKRFVAPSAGLYAFDACVYVANSGVSGQNVGIQLLLNGTTVIGCKEGVTQGGDDLTLNASVSYLLAQGDYLEVWLVSQSTSAIGVDSIPGYMVSYFSGREQ